MKNDAYARYSTNASASVEPAKMYAPAVSATRLLPRDAYIISSTHAKKTMPPTATDTPPIDPYRLT